MRTVVDVRQDGDGYLVVHRATDRGRGVGSVMAHRAADRGRGEVELLRADRVVVAAGTWGTQKLLHGARLRGSLPLISRRLGHLTRTNSEALLGSSLVGASDRVDGSRGVAITTSFHPDPDTHIENVRYGRGSNAMGLLATLLVDGGGSRPRRFLRQAWSAPSTLWASLNKRGWSERSIIGLVMQSLDNSLTLTARLRRDGEVRLISHQGHGTANPTWIPAGHRAMRVITQLLAERAQAPAFDSGSIGDVLDIPMTAHFLGGCPIGESPSSGVIDPYHRLYGYPGISVVDGSAVSANLGVNPALTITAQAERACSLWPNVGDPDPRPDQHAGYRRLAPIAPRNPVVPPGSPGELRWTAGYFGD
jgi:cholesterol oxidase